jgi:multidrug efflux system membrane fusion protein
MSPISGRTGALNVHQGDLVRANDTTPLVVINQVAPIYVTFSVPGRYLPDIRRYQGQQALKIEARIQSAGTPGAPQIAPPNPGTAPPSDGNDGASTAIPPPAPTSITIESGTVSFIDNSVDPTTGTIRMKGTFANADHALWPGLFVQVNLILRTDPNAIVVPSVAVQTSQSGQFVYVVKPDDRTAELRTIAVERQQGDESIISHGVRAGEEIVTDGQLRLNPGSRVTTGTRGDGAGGQGGGGSNEGGRRRGGGGGDGGRRGGNRGNQS